MHLPVASHPLLLMKGSWMLKPRKLRGRRTIITTHKMGSTGNKLKCKGCIVKY